MSTLTLNNWISLHLWKEYTSCDFYKQYLLQGTVALGIPLLRVQTDNDSLTQEQGRPHDYVPDGAFPFVVQNEVEHHCERTKREDNEKLTYRFNLTGFTWPRHDTTIIWCSTTQVISFLLKATKSLTSKAHEEAEEHRIEETKANCKNVLMNHCRHCKHKQHGGWSAALLRDLETETWTQMLKKTKRTIHFKFESFLKYSV